MDGELYRDFTVSSGVWQGDGISCMLFNFALEKVVRRAQLDIPGTIVHKSRQILRMTST